MENLEQLWTEAELIKKFNLPEKDGRSGHVARWVNKGLPVVELIGRRYFREEDLVNFFNNLVEPKKGKFVPFSATLTTGYDPEKEV